MCEQSNKENKSDEVSRDTVYSEMYAEMRRFRDYHLNVASWYTVILLAILTAVLTMKFGSGQPGIFQRLGTNLLVKISILVFATLLGMSSCRSIRYASKRYDELRKYVDDHLEPLWKDFKPKRVKFTPQFFMLTTQILLVLAVYLFILI